MPSGLGAGRATTVRAAPPGTASGSARMETCGEAPVPEAPGCWYDHQPHFPHMPALMQVRVCVGGMPADEPTCPSGADEKFEGRVFDHGSGGTRNRTGPGVALAQDSGVRIARQCS